MSMQQYAKRAEKLIVDNSPAILTAIGVTGAITTAYLAGKASFKAAEILRNESYRREDRHLEDPDTKEKFKLIWKLYIPAAGVGVLTITAVICANRVGMRRAAAMAAAYSVSERAFSEYKEKVIQKIGENKERAVRDEVAQDQVNRSPDIANAVLLIGDVEALFLDSLTGRPFKSTIETIRRIENDANHEILNSFGGCYTLSELYTELGIPTTDYSSEVGWNLDNMLDLSITATIFEGKPVGVMSYGTWPIREYSNRH